MQYIYTMEYYSALKKNENGSYVEMQMDLEVSELSLKEKNKYHLLVDLCGIQKNGIGECICKAEIESQMQKTNLRIPRGKRDDERNWEIGIHTYTLLILFTKQITNENRPYSAANSISPLRCPKWEGSPKGRGYIYVCVQLTHFAVQQKATQRCEATIQQ